ncbi:MAG: hypothetical protein H0T62_04565 [Parachlamydiaceae bacterium]|nr:hypothetical protein [Parachlamydiaceae bacterium]
MLLTPLQICCEEPALPEGITVNLRDPEYKDGILKTEKGGLITADGIRIQAKQILYSRKIVEEKAVCTIEAEDDLLIEFNDYIFVGKRLEYDFQEKTGIIYEGKTAVDPWFFGGEKIFLHADGSYTLFNSYLTTAESTKMEWKLSADKTTLYPNHDLHVRNLKFQYYNYPLLWVPSLRVNLDYLLNFPVRYNARWGGRQGPRVEFSYQIFAWNRWKTFLRFDYRLTRGPGLGLETYYRSEDHKETFEAINYCARDSSLTNPHERLRYRFQGIYTNSFMNDKVSLSLTYDKLSDKDMATDYSDRGINLQYPGATMLQVRRQSDAWIANFLTTMRLNTFQTLKQELPTFRVNWKPLTLGTTGIIAHQLFRASYLDYQYSRDIRHHPDPYHSPRIQYVQQFYRPFRVSSLIITPECGGTLIYYGNLPKENDHGNIPKKNDRWLGVGIFKLDAQMPFFKKGLVYTHTLTPYARYEYYTMPKSKPNNHFIFDIDDGLYELNMLRFGLQQSLYYKTKNAELYRPVRFDLYANSFFNSKTYSRAIPKAYASLDFYSTPFLKHTLTTAWDFEHSMLDHFNLRTECTFSANTALAVEYRHRSEYDFRKADRTNFILEAYRSPKELLNSPLSDRRDTLLLHLFHRFHPLWALEFQMRHGWNRKWDRKNQPNYTEFGMDLIGRPHAAWQVKFSYQHSENDRHRLTVYFNMGSIQLDGWKYDHLVPQVAF